LYAFLLLFIQVALITPFSTLELNFIVPSVAALCVCCSLIEIAVFVIIVTLLAMGLSYNLSWYWFLPVISFVLYHLKFEELENQYPVCFFNTLILTLVYEFFNPEHMFKLNLTEFAITFGVYIAVATLLYIILGSSESTIKPKSTSVYR
jgi:hypothetical protein